MVLCESISLRHFRNPGTRSVTKYGRNYQLHKKSCKKFKSSKFLNFYHIFKNSYYVCSFILLKKSLSTLLLPSEIFSRLLIFDPDSAIT